MKDVSVYDNKGTTMDRYTVVINNDVFTMSTNPLHPQGVNMYCFNLKDEGVEDISHFGKDISHKYLSLPHELFVAICQRVND